MANKCGHPLYRTWVCVRRRARRDGRAVDPRWKDFWAFAADMSPRPEGAEVALVRESAGFAPGNCFWRLRAPLITVDGVSLKAGQWARRLGINRNLISDRLSMGMTPEEAVTRPVRDNWRGRRDSVFRIRTRLPDGREVLSRPWERFADALEEWRARKPAAAAAGAEWEIIRETPGGAPVLVMR